MVLNVTSDLTTEKLTRAFSYMHKAKALYEHIDTANLQEEHIWFPARGHEAFQIAMGMLMPQASVYFPSVRDLGVLIGMGIKPTEIAAQVFRKHSEVFASMDNMPGLNPLNGENYPEIAPQSFDFKGSPTEAVGAALAIKLGLSPKSTKMVVCSLADGAETTGAFLEAIKFASREKLPILFTVQDNDWIAGSPADEVRQSDAVYNTRGFKGIRREEIHGGDFVQSYEGLFDAFHFVQNEQLPMLLLAKCPLIGNFSNMVKSASYRSKEDIESHKEVEPLQRMTKYLRIEGIDEDQARTVSAQAAMEAQAAVEEAKSRGEASFAPPSTENYHYTASATLPGASGQQLPYKELCQAAINELLKKSNAVYLGSHIARPFGGYFGQSNGIGNGSESLNVISLPSVSSLLSGVFCGLSYMGAFPMVELDDNDFQDQGARLAIKSAEMGLKKGLVRVLTGAPVGYGPSSQTVAENVLTGIPNQITVAPSDGTMAAAYVATAYEAERPVFLLEHNLLREAKEAMGTQASQGFALSIPQAFVAQTASEEKQDEGMSLALIAYGIGVHLAKEANDSLGKPAEIIDLGSLHPVDMATVSQAIERHSKALVISVAPGMSGFAHALAAKLMSASYTKLDGAVRVVAAEDTMQVPASKAAQGHSLLTVEKIARAIEEVLAY